MGEMTQRFLTNTLIDAQALVEELRKPKPIDWPAEARKAAIAFHAQEIQREGLEGASVTDIAEMACDHAIALIDAMKRREAFVGGG